MTSCRGMAAEVANPGGRTGNTQPHSWQDQANTYVQPEKNSVHAPAGWA